jgi:hypothetical protein
MPIAITSLSEQLLFCSASRATSRWLRKISTGSCSTQPGRAHRRAFLIEQDRARAGGALVEGEDVLHEKILAGRC